MIRTTQRTFACAALFAAALLATPQSARAYDVDGIGVGAEAMLGGGALGGGLALNVGLGALELEFLLAANFSLPDGGVLEPDFLGAFGLYGTLYGGDTTNFQLGGRIGGIVDGNGSGIGIGGAELDVRGGVLLEALLRLEHALDDHAVLNFNVGIQTRIFPDTNDGPAGDGTPDFGMGIGQTGFVAAAGFRFYFNPLGTGGGSRAAAAPARSSSAVAPAPAPTATDTPSTAAAPAWE